MERVEEDWSLKHWNQHSAHKERTPLILRRLCRSYAKMNTHEGPKKFQVQSAKHVYKKYLYSFPIRYESGWRRGNIPV